MIRTVTLGEICAKITSGGTPSTKHAEYYDGDIPWLRTQEIDFNRIRSTEKTITESGLKSSSAKMIPANSVIIAMYGATAGKVAINKVPLTTNQACCNLIIDSTKANYEYVFYYLQNQYEWLLGQATGAAQQNLGTRQISNMKIKLPDLVEQKRIAEILGNLDAKIDLNREIVKNLESLASAIFTQTFTNNPDYHKWQKVSLSDLCDKVASGGTPQTKRADYYGGDISWFSTKELSDGFLFESEKNITLTGLGNSSAKLFPENTVTMAIYAAPTVGRLGILTHPSAFNQATVGLVAKQEIGYEFIYLFLLNSRRDLNNLANGAAQQNISVGKVRDFMTFVPEKQLIRSFRDQVAPIFEHIRSLATETQTLTTTRDYLLPRLIDGRIKI